MTVEAAERVIGEIEAQLDYVQKLLTKQERFLETQTKMLESQSKLQEMLNDGFEKLVRGAVALTEAGAKAAKEEREVRNNLLAQSANAFKPAHPEKPEDIEYGDEARLR